MKHLIWFCSHHGFGHAARSAAVINALFNLRPDLRITCVTAVPRWFFLDTPVDIPLNIVPIPCDVGFIQKTSFDIDFAETLKQLRNLYPVSNDWIETVFAQTGPADAVVCDISPAGLAFAKQMGIPSILLENFTWSFLYRPYLDSEPDLISFSGYFDELTQSANLRFNLSPYCEIPAGAVSVGPVARRSRQTPAEVRNRLGIRSDAKMVLVTTGGIDTRLSIKVPNEFENLQLVISGGTETLEKGPGFIRIPHRSGFYHPDLVEASDLVVGKLGYSTVAEAAVAGKPLLYLTRKNFAETAPLAGWVQYHMVAREIQFEQLFDGTWAGEGLPTAKVAIRNHDEMLAGAMSSFLDTL